MKWSWLALLVVASCSGAEQAQERVVETVVRALLEEDDPWLEVEVQSPEDLSHGSLTPSWSADVDGADRESLILVPPAAAEFEVRASDGDCTLRAAAGVDFTVARDLPENTEPLRVTFRVSVNGEPRSEVTVETERGERDVPRTWVELGPDGKGVPLRAGDRVRLETLLLGDSPLPRNKLKLGFADLLLVGTESAPIASAGSGPPNIVLVCMDTQRRDRMGLYGYERDTTPHFDRFAQEGLAFDDAWSTASWTWPAIASLFTGLLPDAHGVTSPRSSTLVHSHEVLAERLQRAGYATGAFVANPLIHPTRQFDQGFDDFEGVTEFTPGEVVLPGALAWLEAHGEQRFFLYLHLVDPHAPHTPAPEFAKQFIGSETVAMGPNSIEEFALLLKQDRARTPAGPPDFRRLLSQPQVRWLKDLYDASAATGDAHFGRLLETLETLGLRDNTVVVYVADHGEELFDHGMLSHAHTLYPELVRVPLAMRGPGIPAGLRRSEPVSLHSVFDTLLGLAGVESTPDQGAFDLLADAAPAHPLFFSTEKGFWHGREMSKIFGIRSGPWVLQYCPKGLPWHAEPGSDPGTGQMRLFHHAVDPLHTKDLVGSQPVLAKELRSMLQARLARDGSMRPKTVSRAGARMMEMLRQAGYLESED